MKIPQKSLAISTDVLATGPDWIKVEFNGGVDVGAAWELIGPMAGISPAVAWPQAGVALA